jgi:hypothetical protein
VATSGWPPKLVVRVCVDSQIVAYAFRCSQCGVRAAKPADDRIVDVLIAAGAHLQLWYLPRELSERHADGPPVNHDDVLDFHFLLLQANWFERLQAVVDRAAGAISQDVSPSTDLVE